MKALALHTSTVILNNDFGLILLLTRSCLVISLYFHLHLQSTVIDSFPIQRERAHLSTTES